MNQEDTIARFKQGKDAWNAWAEEMLAERKAMEADGRWSAEREPWGDRSHGTTRPAIGCSGQAPISPPFGCWRGRLRMRRQRRAEAVIH